MPNVYVPVDVLKEVEKVRKKYKIDTLADAFRLVVLKEKNL